jgi:hypothetical protein
MALSPPIRGRTSYACEPAGVSLLASTPYSTTSSAQRQIVKTKCPLWVISRHHALKSPCPLYPQKRTSLSTAVMSALCQKRTSVAAEERNQRVVCLLSPMA